MANMHLCAELAGLDRSGEGQGASRAGLGDEGVELVVADGLVLEQRRDHRVEQRPVRL